MSKFTGRSTSRWQGRYREVGSEGSLNAKIWGDEQKHHIRPSLRVSQHNMIKPMEHRRWRSGTQTSRHNKECPALL